MISRRSGDASTSSSNNRIGRRFANSPSSLRIFNKPHFRTCLGGRVVPLRTAHRTQQNRVAGAASVDRFLGQRIAASVDRDAADQVRLKVKLVAETSGNGLENARGLGNDFGADAVTGQ